MASAGGTVEGIVVVDRHGTIQFAQGLGEDIRVKSLAGHADWMAEIRVRRLQPFTIDRRSYVVLQTPVAVGDLLLFSRAPSQAVLDFIGSVDFAYDILGHLLTDPFDAMTIVDDAARVVYISPVHEGFFGLSHGEANGRPVKDVIENTRLDRVVATGKAEVGEIQSMRGAERVVTRTPIKRGDEVIGAVGRVMFKGPEQVETLSRRINMLEREVEFYKREAAAIRNRSYGLDMLIGDSAPMRRLRDEIIKVAPLEIPVLIRGESGTGKELVAQALHRLSARRDSAIVMVNAAALPATLVESELFGYEPGAFTGADKKGRKGKFEQAAGGSIFLDEIGDMPMEVQAKLLRVLQDRIVERIGSDRPQHVDFRLVTATNHDLQELVTAGRFRLDLFYRISAITIEIPPLRSRVDDIPDLVAHFVKDVADRHRQPAPDVSDSALSYLMEQPWPGNVRQLRHEVERAFVFAENGRITEETLAPASAFRSSQATAVSAAQSIAITARKAATLKSSVGQVEAELATAALLRNNGNKKQTAKELGISRSYLYKLIGNND
ncbi:sigma-54 interaction domain-containing protein [Bosea sp. NPDC055594]